MAEPFRRPAVPPPGPAAGRVTADWAPVLYGRTRSADTWWRVVPEGVDQHGWLDGVVQAAVADGAGLRDGARFLFAQNGVHRIVGVACRASELSNTMRSDGVREMYCFVGWLTETGPGGGAPGPEWARFEREYRAWAGAVYARWMEPVWTAPASTLRRPRRAAAEAAPWPEPVRRATGPVGGARFVPPEGWAALWDGAGAGTAPVTIVLGWPSADRARGDAVTHLGVLRVPADARHAPAFSPPAARQAARPFAPAPPGPPGPPPRMPPGPAHAPPGRSPAAGPPVAALALAAGGAVLLGTVALMALVLSGGDDEPKTVPLTGAATVQPGHGLAVGAGLPADLNGALRYDGGRLTAAPKTVAATLPTATAPSERACGDRLRENGAALPAGKTGKVAGLGVCLRTGASGRLAFVRVDAERKKILDVTVTIWKHG
ncbi:hypothetical protein [Actinomadura decatromicini]|uniref:Uncharacterized protein n=1 Tax=Actinomadura decatromicini TaxID=2604572 RepID=A0A5D3FAC3_9ACTN|nr:hypothetical protein [Actinomadura decatromicini]TYK44295.1 hypothetical protein FXF68_32930 [Actinomadura decatromicini]